MPADRIVEAREHAFAVLDDYPVSPGHTLAIARRHVAAVFELRADEINSSRGSSPRNRFGTAFSELASLGLNKESRFWYHASPRCSQE
jgi:hypothetical protein